MVLPMIAAGIGAGSNILSSYMNFASNRRNRKLAKSEHQAAVAQSGRNLAQAGEDITRGRRQLLEGLAARGVGDSTIARDDQGYYDRRSQRMLEALNAQANLTRKRYKNFKKTSKYGKWMDILGMVSQGAGAMGAVAGMAGAGGSPAGGGGSMDASLGGYNAYLPNQ